MHTEHYRKLERMYLSAKINTMIYDTTGVSIEEGKAEISLMLSEKYYHALGAMHGSVYFKLLDDACFFAVNSLVTDVFVLTTAFEVRLKRPESTGTVTAHGVVTEPGEHTFRAHAILYNEKQKELARGTGTFVKSTSRLSPAIGYQ